MPSSYNLNYAQNGFKEINFALDSILAPLER